MDSIFFLEAEARRLFLRDAGRALGCLYISLWSYIPPPSNCLVCMDAWFHEDDATQPSTTFLSVPQRLFDAYKRSSCSIQDSSVPGIAFRQGLPYFELRESELITSASFQVQQRFYQEAGVKTAVFLGCNGGEAEIGMPTLMTNTKMQMDIRQLFIELIPSDLSMPSSSPSSSLRSVSVGSPDYSPLLLTKPSTTHLADNFRDTATKQATPPYLLSMQAFSQYRQTYFPNKSSEDDAMANAMLAVISSSSSSNSHPPPPMLNQPVGAFRPYNSSLAPRTDPKNTTWQYSQKMIKMAIALSKRINLMKFKSPVIQEQRPTSNQLHHMISERKRREKLNESFLALRNLLPPGSKKDKASVLAYTKDYLNTLKAEISELQQKNEILEKKLLFTDVTPENADDSNEKFKVQITRLSESTSQGQRITLSIDVREECNIIVFVLRVLECLKSMSFITLVSINASTLPSHLHLFSRVTLTLQVEASDWDEASFKETVTRVVAETVARPETES
ncbi:putative transcription factor bHLH family [Dioscorea sansibarensis]